MSDRTSDLVIPLYKHWAPRLFNHFRRMSWSADEASDLTSEVFAIALEHLPEVRDNDRLGAWLWTIAHRRAANVRRDEARRREREAVAAAEQTITQVSGSHQRLHRALDALDEDARQLMLWREYSGLSYDEIARLTGRTRDSIRAALYRARQQLREEYQKRAE